MAWLVHYEYNFLLLCTILRRVETLAPTAKIREEVAEKEREVEIPRLQRLVGRPSLEEVFRDFQSGGKQKRNAAFCVAHMQHGYTLKEISEHLGMHYTSVSKIL